MAEITRHTSIGKGRHHIQLGSARLGILVSWATPFTSEGCVASFPGHTQFFNAACSIKKTGCGLGTRLKDVACETIYWHTVRENSKLSTAQVGVARATLCHTLATPLQQHKVVTMRCSLTCTLSIQS